MDAYRLGGGREVAVPCACNVCVCSSSGGELMDAYRLGGGREVEKLILEQFSVFTYNEGRGKEITRTEYLKWKLRGKTRDEVRPKRHT